MTQPEELGAQIFLFVFGDLVDAFQSQKIGFQECIGMAFQALFFIDIWGTFLEEELPEYPQNHYCLSQESLQIC